MTISESLMYATRMLSCAIACVATRNAAMLLRGKDQSKLWVDIYWMLVALYWVIRSIT